MFKKSFQNSPTSPPKIQNNVQKNKSNSNLDQSVVLENGKKNKTVKNKKLQKLNWQNSHRKNDKKNDKKSKFGKKAETRERKLSDFKYLNNNKDWQNNSQNSDQSENSQGNEQSSKQINQSNSEKDNQINNQKINPFSSFYHKKMPNLSKFQNNIQNIAQNLNSQINQIPNKINQNLASFEQNNSQIDLNQQQNEQIPFSKNDKTFYSNPGLNILNSNLNSDPTNNGFFSNNSSNLQNKLQDKLQSNFLKSNLKPGFKANSDFNSDNYKAIQKKFRNNSTTVSGQFAVRHTYRAGAIVWVKYRGENYYVVFRSLTRPSRGIQLPGGRIERMENVADAVTREVYEEIGIQTRILCPLGYLFTENPTDNFSRMEIYYIVRPIFPIDVFRYWQHQDLDEKRQAVEKRQTLECWCVPCSRDIDFLSFEQGKAVLMFRDWLSKHKRVEPEHTANF